MKINSSTAPLNEHKKEALIIFFQGLDNLIPAGNSALKKEIDVLVKNSAFKGQAGQTAVFPMLGKQLIVAGLGEAKHFHNGLLDQAAASAVRTGKETGLKSFAIPASIKIKGISEADYLLLAGRGAAWGTYSYDIFKSDAKKQVDCSLAFCGTVKAKAVLKAAQAQGEALVSTADIANMPGNKATPIMIADWAKTMAKKNGLGCQIMDRAALNKKGCGGILGVSQGSAQEPRMIILKHKGTDPKAKPIVLVGKTLTFDSGGISLKPGKGMGWMRYDKCGGMAVLTAMQMIAKIKPKTPVIGILGAAENMPGSNAIRPGDIITAYKGKTVEVLNTDAEGRLVLMDALGLAADQKPQAIVDLATLTGACIVALGSAASAVLGNDQKLINTLIKNGTSAGERLWQLPMYKEYSDEMKSDFADLSNLGKTGGAGTATAAAFLQEFVPENIPWAHLDIAGTGWVESAKPYQASGATLVGARMLTEWIVGLD